MILFAKSSATTWNETLVTAFGGLLIGAAIAFASVRQEIVNKKGSRKR